MGQPTSFSQQASDERYTQFSFVEANYLGLHERLRLDDDNLVWTDLTYELTPSVRGSNTKPDFSTTEVGLLFPQNDPSEIVYCAPQFLHSWKAGTTVYPHVHFHQAAATNPVFKIDYRWTALGAAVGSWTTGYTMSELVFPYSSGTISQIATNTTGISGAGKGISSILQIKLYRDDNVVTGDVLATSFDIHFAMDSMGSETQFSKY